MGENTHREGFLPRLRFSLEELETFLTVAELSSFSRAAEVLGLSQPSVTGRIQRLERSVGVKLLARTSRQMIATEEGERLRLAAEAALHDLRLLLRDFRLESEAEKHRIILAATPLLAAVVVLPIIKRYMQTHAGVEIKLHDVSGRQVQAEILSGAADMAIMVLDQPHPELQFDPLTVEECVVVTPTNHPLLAKGEATFEDIIEFPILLPDFYQTVRHVLETEYTKRGLAFQPMAQMNDVSNISTVIGMVAAGMGITFVPRTLISQDRRSSIGMIRTSGFRVVRHYGFVTRRGKPLSATARSFARFVRRFVSGDASGWSVERV